MPARLTTNLKPEKLNNFFFVDTIQSHSCILNYHIKDITTPADSRNPLHHLRSQSTTKDIKEKEKKKGI